MDQVFLAKWLAEFAGVSFCYVTKAEKNVGQTEVSVANTVWQRETIEGIPAEQSEAFAEKPMLQPEAISENPVWQDEPFREKIISLAAGQDAPLVLRDESGVVFVCIKSEEGDFCFGPVALRAMSRTELHRFYRNHGIKGTEDKPFKIMTVAKILEFVRLAAGIIENREYTRDALLRANVRGVSFESSSEGGMPQLSMEAEERESYHHTYHEELQITDAVAEGRGDDAVRFSMELDDLTGAMGSGMLEQAERTAIVSITVCTRAAIRGGLSPADAYQISDYYLQKLDTCTNEAAITACRNEAVRLLADRVRKKKEEKKVSSYVDACCDYVGRHYREKIYLDDIAEKMGISPTYLSRLFSREKGMTLQEYVVRVRVDRAANLLTYSESPIAAIGDYVNFPSQSYFSKVFRKYKGMSPKQYREANKPKEFTV